MSKAKSFSTLAAAGALAVGIATAASADTIRIGYAPSVWDPSDFHGMMGSGIEDGLKNTASTTSF